MDKVLLITGASSEVGTELLKRIHRNYSRIYLQYRSMNEKFQSIVDEIRTVEDIVLLQADFMDTSSVQKMIGKIKNTGVLPNQIVHFPAPKAYNMQFHKDKWEKCEQGFWVSVRSIYLILQAFIPNMAKARYGRIVFMLTSCTKNYPAKYQSSYVTVKYALLGLMKSLSVEYAEKGITVNGVSPDMMETKFLSEIQPKIIEQNTLNSPLRRNIYINEVIPIIEYMLSDDGAAMTGENIGITGGGN